MIGAGACGPQTPSPGGRLGPPAGKAGSRLVRAFHVTPQTAFLTAPPVLVVKLWAGTRNWVSLEPQSPGCRLGSGSVGPEAPLLHPRWAPTRQGAEGRLCRRKRRCGRRASAGPRSPRTRPPSWGTAPRPAGGKWGRPGWSPPARGTSGWAASAKPGRSEKGPPQASCAPPPSRHWQPLLAGHQLPALDPPDWSEPLSGPEERGAPSIQKAHTSVRGRSHGTRPCLGTWRGPPALGCPAP